MDTSDIYPRRINAKEVLSPHRCQYVLFFFFSSSWEQQNRQEKTAYSKYPLQNRNNLYRVKISGEKFKANWKGFNRQNQKDDDEARKDFGSIQGDFIQRHHLEPRVQLCVSKEETFPIPLKYMGVTRATQTHLDVLQEKRNDDNWNVDMDRRLSKKPPNGFLWSG